VIEISVEYYYRPPKKNRSNPDPIWSSSVAPEREGLPSVGQIIRLRDKRAEDQAEGRFKVVDVEPPAYTFWEGKGAIMLAKLMVTDVDE